MKKVIGILAVVACIAAAAWWVMRTPGPSLDAEVRRAATAVPADVLWVGFLPPMGDVEDTIGAANEAIEAFVPGGRGIEGLDAAWRDALGVDPERRGVVGQLAGVAGDTTFAVVHRVRSAPSFDEGLAAGWPDAEIGECESPRGPCRRIGEGIRAVLDGRVMYLMVDTPGMHDALIEGLDAPLADDPAFVQTMRFTVEPLVAGFTRPASWLDVAERDLPRWMRGAVDDARSEAESIEGMGVAVARETGRFVVESTFWSSEGARWNGVWDAPRSPDLIDELPGRADGFFHVQADMRAFERATRILLEDDPETAAWLDEASEDASSFGVADPFQVFEVLSGEVAGVGLRGGERLVVVGLAQPERAIAWLDEQSEGIVSGLTRTDVEGATVYRVRLLGVRLAAAVIEQRLWIATMPVLRDVLRGDREALTERMSPQAAAAVRGAATLVAALEPAWVVDGVGAFLPGPARDLGDDLVTIIDDVVLTSFAEGRFNRIRLDVVVDDAALSDRIGATSGD